MFLGKIFVRDALLYREGYTKSESWVNVNFPSAYKITFKTFKSANKFFDLDTIALSSFRSKI